jgi:dipeptide/tripeptide permease
MDMKVELSQKARKRPWILWLVAFVALGGLMYSALGISMIASLAPDPPTRQWTVAAYAYLAAFVVSFAALVAALITLFRRRKRDRSNPSSAAV